MERNLDADINCDEASEEPDAGNSKVEKGAGKRRHSLSATLNFLHLN